MNRAHRLRAARRAAAVSDQFVNIQKEEHTQYLLKVSCKVFDDKGELRIYTCQEWDDHWIRIESHPLAAENVPMVSDEDIPF